MDPEFECRATAALLRSASPIVMASHVGAILAGFTLQYEHAARAFAAISLMLWAFVILLAIRVRLDAGLFELLAGDPQNAPAEVEGFLARAGFRQGPNRERTIAERCQGARGLWRALIVSAVLQGAALAAALVRSLP